MKTTKYILLALTTLFMASCMDKDWDAPSEEVAMDSYGNPNLQATNVKTVAELKTIYATEIKDGKMTQITQPTQIIVTVTGNDLGGNLYNEVAVQDDEGTPILVEINQGGLYGYLPVGQRILIELKGLYVSGYRRQAQIGGVYKTGSIGGVERFEWVNHFKILGAEEIPTPVEVTVGGTATQVELIRVDNGEKLDLAKDCGRLVTIKNVEIQAADGKNTYAPSNSSEVAGNGVSRAFKGINSDYKDGKTGLVLRTSIFAEFANEVMPMGKVNVTGILTRYSYDNKNLENNCWQFLMRTIDDIEPAVPYVYVAEQN